MFAVDELKRSGFKFWLEGEKIRYKQVTEGPVDEAWINNLLQNIKEHKQEAIRYLQPKSVPAVQPETSDIKSHPKVKVAEPKHKQRLVEACYCCHEKKWWIDRYGNRKCGICHPPASEKIVKEWIQSWPWKMLQTSTRAGDKRKNAITV